MKWFRKSKTKAKSKSTSDINTQAYQQRPAHYGTPPVSSQLLAKLPPPLIERIFSFVCPHAQDETYESCEQSAVEDTCMLCDLRDLSHCSQVSKRWRTLANNVLYHSIRIDTVHYCDREDILAEKRKRRSFLRSNAEPEDTAQARLQLLCRTLRENQETLAPKVQFLKIPYMTRETCKADLARTVAVLRYLRFVDLPEGLYQDDASCHTLKQEVQVRCPDIRKMSYIGGAERSLEVLAGGNIWRNLEVIELSRLNMDPTILRQALGCLPNLHALKVMEMDSFSDDLFQHSDYILPFPALTELIFVKTPNLTVQGLTTYLFRSDVQDTLTTLSLTETGVHPPDLHQVLVVAPRLTKLSLVESVSASFPASGNFPLLQSKSLRVLHYEIETSYSTNAYANTAASYYSYLTSSLIGGGLPNLRQLYVRDPNFPESLIHLAPPAAPFTTDPDNFLPPTNKHLSPLASKNPFAPTQRMQSSPGLKQELEVYSKGLDEMEWNFSKVQPPKGHGRRGSATIPRPVSSYGLSDSMKNGMWAQGTRKSVIVGNGFGGFLAVPADGDGRPNSSGGEHRRRGSQYDMWR